MAPFEALRESLYQPSKIFLICLLFGLSAIVFDGSFFRYVSLQETEAQLDTRISQIEQSTHHLRSQIEKTKDPRFIERQARERLDFVGDDEIVFVFSNEE